MAEHANTEGTDFAGADAAGHAASPVEAHGGAHGHGDAHGGEHHNPHLHHHFDTEQQQFDSDKLGMWLFLTTEILLFAGLFCAYAVYRANHPEMFLFAHKFLDVKWGFINTIILLFSSFTMAWAVRAAQLGQKKLLVPLLAVTILCGFGFLGVKAIEYTAKFKHGTTWGKTYKPTAEALEEHVDEDTYVKLIGHAPETPSAVAAKGAGVGSAAPQSPSSDTLSATPTANSGTGTTTEPKPTVPLSPGTVPAAPEAGKENENVMPGSSKVLEQQQGQMQDSSGAVHGIAPGALKTEPPAEHQTETKPTSGAAAEPPAASSASASAGAAGAATPSAAPAGGAPAAVTVDEGPDIVSTSAPPLAPATAPPTYIARDPATGKLLVDHSQVPPATRGPAGLAYVPTAKRIGTHESSHEEPHTGHKKWHGDIPPNPQIFFSIYFMMTGLHGIHVIIGMICIFTVMIISMRGGYGADYMTPVDLVGLYWHLVDLIWIFLFPLLYLIH